MSGLERVGQAPAYYLMGEDVGEKMKIRHAFLGLYICYVRNPKLVDRRRAEAPDKIPVLAVVVVGAGGVALAVRLEHQPVVMHDAVEAVAPTHLVGADVLEDEEKLVGPYAGSLTAYGLDRRDDVALQKLDRETLRTAHAVITFAGLAKQSAQATQGKPGMPGPKVVYCLAPAFFSRSMPYLSLHILITS